MEEYNTEYNGQPEAKARRKDSGYEAWPDVKALVEELMRRMNMRRIGTQGAVA